MTSLHVSVIIIARADGWTATSLNTGHAGSGAWRIITSRTSEEGADVEVSVATELIRHFLKTFV